jgi:hypothetical protein
MSSALLRAQAVQTLLRYMIACCSAVSGRCDRYLDLLQRLHLAILPFSLSSSIVVTTKTFTD